MKSERSWHCGAEGANYLWAPKLAFLTPPVRPLSEWHLPSSIPGWRNSKTDWPLAGIEMKKILKKKKKEWKRSNPTANQKKNLRDPTTPHRRLLPKIERSTRSNGRTDVLWLATLWYTLEMWGWRDRKKKVAGRRRHFCPGFRVLMVFASCDRRLH